MRRLLFTAILIISFSAVRAEPIDLTRQQASELFVALTRIEPGLTAENVVVAADNINALKPIVEALDKGKVRASRDIDSLPASAERTAKAWALREQIDAKGDEPVKVDLIRFDVSPDEIKAAKIAPRDLAPLRQFLRKK